MQKNTLIEIESDSIVHAEDLLPRTTLVSRNITILGRRTSVRLEPEMWLALREIANREHCSVHDVCSLISICKKPKSSLTASIRVFLMLYFRAATTDEGHKRAGHGSFEFMKKRAKVPGQEMPAFSKRKRNYYSNKEEPGEEPAYLQRF